MLFQGTAQAYSNLENLGIVAHFTIPLVYELLAPRLARKGSLRAHNKTASAGGRPPTKPRALNTPVTPTPLLKTCSTHWPRHPGRTGPTA